MKLYSFKAHEIGTEVWYVPRKKVVRTEIVRVRCSFRKDTIYITYFVERINNVYGEAQVYGKVFLTKEEAEGSL